MKTKLLIICSLLFSSQVFAEWTKIAKSKSGMIAYLDYDRTKKHNGYVYYYMLGDHLKPKYGYLSHENYYQGDCGSLRFKEINFVFYKQSMGKGPGDSVESANNKVWQSVKPNTMNAIILKEVCKQDGT